MSNEYEVGYKKPPVHSRFKAGQSGNPKGRVKGSKNFKTLMNNVLNEKISVTENGRTHKISKGDASIRRLVNKGLGGDIRALSLILAYLQRMDMEEEDKKLLESYSSEADQEILANFLKRCDTKGEKADE